MSKLFKLKKWLTLPDAARHLSVVFDEEVTEADILRLVLDGHLKLSVQLVNGARATPCNTVEVAELEWEEVSGLDGEVIMRHKGGPITSFENGVTLQFIDGVTELDAAVWDLPMIGDEKYDIEHKCQDKTGGPTVKGGCLDGAFVASTNGRYFQLLEQVSPREIDTPQGKEKIGEHYIPAFGLPDDSVLVVRTDALREFEQSISGVAPMEEKPLKSRERATLLTIIAALAKEAKIDLSRPSKAAGLIAPLTELVGARVSERAIEEHLKKIPEALEGRAK